MRIKDIIKRIHKMKIIFSIIFAGVVCGMIGCATPKSTPDPVQKRMSIVEAVEKLVADPVFSEKRAADLKNAKRKRKARPVVTIMRIENNVDESGDGKTAQMYRRLQSAVRKTGKFDIVDPEKSLEFAEPDFVMSGELVKEETGELSLNLDMEDVHEGTVFWNEVVTPSDSFGR